MPMKGRIRAHSTLSGISGNAEPSVGATNGPVSNQWTNPRHQRRTVFTG